MYEPARSFLVDLPVAFRASHLERDLVRHPQAAIFP
jgi:hypothetical protein